MDAGCELLQVVEQWRPGEVGIATSAALIARLAGRVDELPEEFLGDEKRAQQLDSQGREALMKMLESGEMPWDALAEQPLLLELRCTECARTYQYEADQAFVDPEVVAAADGPEGWDKAVVLDRIITCKNCGAVDAYELTPRAHVGLWARMERAFDSDEPFAEQVVMARPQLYDGTLIHRPSEAIAHLEENARRHPRSAEAWRRLGNLSEKYHEPDKAERAWRKAVEVDDDEVEAAYSLAEHLWNPHEPNNDAFNFALIALERLPRAELDEEPRRPCPCGSGRKYKRCCLRKG